MAFHVDQLLDGNIDKNDFMNVVEDIMAELNLREEVEIPGSVLNKIAASVSNPATGAKAMLDFYKQIQDKENIDLATNAKFKMAIDKLRDLADDKEMDEVMGIDRKGNKKDDTKDTMLSKARMTMKESSQEESLADYLIKSYTNPKTGKSLVDDRMISDFMKTVPEWEDIFDGSEEGNDSIDKEFQDFLFLNYDSLDEVKDKKEMVKLEEHFNRFK